MKKINNKFSNEIVFRGHPDKVCDQISDAILDACLEQDKESRCGIEVVGGKGIIFITGEITSKAIINVKEITLSVLKKIGIKEQYKILNNIGIQSADIALRTSEQIMGAGDQGMIYGYACNDNQYYLPTAMVILLLFAKKYNENLVIKYPSLFLPDGKAQITGIYDANNRLIAIDTFLVSYQNPENQRKESDALIRNEIIKLTHKFNLKVNKILINPTGRFKIGGFEGDSGLTGRKIVVDNYEGFSRIGGGAFSGKDPTKVDRSAAFKARQLAIRFLKKYNLKWCEVQLSYAIGQTLPLAINIKGEKISDKIIRNFPVSQEIYEECIPFQIIKDFNLRNIKYSDGWAIYGIGNSIFKNEMEQYEQSKIG